MCVPAVCVLALRLLAPVRRRLSVSVASHGELLPQSALVALSARVLTRRLTPSATTATHARLIHARAVSARTLRLNALRRRPRYVSRVRQYAPTHRLAFVRAVRAVAATRSAMRRARPAQMLRQLAVALPADFHVLQDMQTVTALQTTDVKLQ